jgi:hypothetical protein
MALLCNSHLSCHFSPWLSEYEPAQEELVASVEDAGFDGRLLGAGAERGTARLHVDGMICSACRRAA